MKILMATDAYIYQAGGITNVVLSLVHELRRLGHEVRVLTLSNSKESFKNEYGYFIRSFRVYYYPDQRRSLVRKSPLIDELTDWGPDLVHIHTEGSIMRIATGIAKKCGVPIVMTVHTDYLHFIFGRFRNFFLIKFLGQIWGSLTYKRAAAIIAPSEKAAHFVTVKTLTDRIRVIPNGIETNRYQKEVSPERRAELFRKCGFEDNGHTMVVISRVSKEKNIGELIRYMPALLEKEPQAQLIIVGNGPARKSLEALSAKRNLTEHIRFTGHIDPDEVYEYYSLGDIFLSASTFEVCSMTYLEALSCGLPVVVREDWSVVGIISHGENGFIYRTKDEYIKDVSMLMDDPQLRKEMSENSLQSSREFTDEKCAERTFALFEEVLDQSGNR